MNVQLKVFFFSSILVLSTISSAQFKSDIGIRFASADENRFQVEFRNRFSENYSFRISSSIGKNGFQRIGEKVLDANDSVITYRYGSMNNLSYGDLRIGFERKLNWNFLSVYADLILGYHSRETNYLTSWQTFYGDPYDDDEGHWDQTILSPNYDPTSGLYVWDYRNHAKATKYFFCPGIALGASFDYPLAKHFILNMNANYSSMIRVQVKQKIEKDPLGEFTNAKESYLNLYGSVGVGLRYVFGKNSTQ